MSYTTLTFAIICVPNDKALAQESSKAATLIGTETPSAAFDQSLPAFDLSRAASSGLLTSPNASAGLPNVSTREAEGSARTMFDAGTRSEPAPKYARVIPAGQVATHFTAGDEVIFGLGSAISVNSGIKAVLAAGYTHLTDGQPNYGVDSTAFAQRVGASAARSASQDIFTKSVMAPLLHQDPRYYVLGPDARLLHRLTYAATRSLITRTNSGRQTVNGSLLIGYAGASLLTRTYYPQINRNTGDEFKAYASSIGGSAIGFVFDEFAEQFLKAVHARH